MSSRFHSSVARSVIGRVRPVPKSASTTRSQPPAFPAARPVGEVLQPPPSPPTAHNSPAHPVAASSRRHKGTPPPPSPTPSTAAPRRTRRRRCCPARTAPRRGKLLARNSGHSSKIASTTPRPARSISSSPVTSPEAIAAASMARIWAAVRSSVILFPKRSQTAHFSAALHKF